MLSARFSYRLTAAELLFTESARLRQALVSRQGNGVKKAGGGGRELAQTGVGGSVGHRSAIQDLAPPVVGCVQVLSPVFMQQVPRKAEAQQLLAAVCTVAQSERRS